MGKVVIFSLEDSESEVFDRIKEVIECSNIINVEKLEINNKIHIGEIIIDFSRYMVLKGKREINLTNIEFKILYFLASHKGMAVSKERLYEYVWQEKDILDDSNITSHIRRLRIKIEDNPAEPRYIQTVRGIGYKMPCEDNIN